MYGVVSQPRPSSCVVIKSSHSWMSWIFKIGTAADLSVVTCCHVPAPHWETRESPQSRKDQWTVGQIMRKLLSLCSHLSEKSKLEWTDLHASCQIFALFPSCIQSRSLLEQRGLPSTGSLHHPTVPNLYETDLMTVGSLRRALLGLQSLGLIYSKMKIT